MADARGNAYIHTYCVISVCRRRKPSEAASAAQSAPPSSSPLTSSSSSPSASASPTTSDPTKADPDCSRVDGRRRTTLDRWVFAFQCNRDIAGSRYDVAFLRGITALDDCLFACARYNLNLNANGCRGVVFSPGEFSGANPAQREIETEIERGKAGARERLTEETAVWSECAVKNSTRDAPRAEFGPGWSGPGDPRGLGE